MGVGSAANAIGGLTLPLWDRVLGAILLLHFLVVCGIKWGQGGPAEILWMSHIALLLTGLGLCLRSPRLVATALVAVLIPHAIWLFDCGVGMTLGRFPLGICAYLESADWWTWIATLHHFYLVPLLLFLFARVRRVPREAFLAAVALFLYLTVVGRVCLPPMNNVNYAFLLLPGVDLPAVHWFNGLPRGLYLLALNAVMGGLVFLPTALLLKRCAVR